MLLTVAVATVGTFVLIYAVGYMKRESGLCRFYAVMSLFLAAMQALEPSGDWVLLLAAWELIGLCSYPLIGFWFQRPEGRGCRRSRFPLTPRSADLGLYVAVFMLIGSAGTGEIAASLEAGGSASTAAGLLLLLAAMGKSAQVPFAGLAYACHGGADTGLGAAALGHAGGGGCHPADPFGPAADTRGVARRRTCRRRYHGGSRGYCTCRA